MAKIYFVGANSAADPESHRISEAIRRALEGDFEAVLSARLRPGEPFENSVREAIESSDALVLILDPTRLEQLRAISPDSFGTDISIGTTFTMEIELSLKEGIPVVPILVGRAELPTPYELPYLLRFLGWSRAIQVSSIDAGSLSSLVARILEATKLKRSVQSVESVDELVSLLSPSLRRGSLRAELQNLDRANLADQSTAAFDLLAWRIESFSAAMNIGTEATERDQSISISRRNSSRRLLSLLAASSMLATAAWLFADEMKQVFQQVFQVLGFGLIGSPLVRKERVEVSVFAPARIPCRSTLQIQFFAHLPTAVQRDAAQELAKDIDPDASRRARQPLASKIPKGAVVSFSLTPSNKAAESVFAETELPTTSLIWMGEPVSADTFLDIPTVENATDMVLRAIVAVDGAPIGEITFKVSLVPKMSTAAHWDKMTGKGLAESSAKRYQNVFMSYAREDLDKVSVVARAYDKLEQSYFWDIEKLRDGEDWEPALYRAIEGSDAFFLFWSENARQSEMVRKETKHALRCQEVVGQPLFVPFPIEGPPIPQPWTEIAGKHVGDQKYYLNTSIKSSRAKSD